MSNVKSAYGSGGQAITCSLASLASGSARASTVIDNSSNTYLDVLVQLKIKSGASGILTTGYAAVYAYGTADSAGVGYPEANAGVDGAASLVSPTNLKLIGIVNIVAATTTYVSEPMSVAAAFGGVLPDHWGIVVLNSSGGAFDSTEGNHAKVYQGVYATVV